MRVALALSGTLAEHSTVADVRNDLQYTKEHEYVKAEAGDVVTIGITDYAQGELGDVVYVELPKVGAKFNSHEWMK